jgi:xeroderma pigmentosum group C-complementing protein
MDNVISLDQLSEAARTRSGSRDVGAWLFTALLRSTGVESRLVCSLQPLQFGFANEGARQDFYDTAQPQASTAVEMVRASSHISISSTDEPAQNPARKPSARIPSFPGSSNRNSGAYTNPSDYIAQAKTFSPNHPYFWCEAWDVASQKWIVVEPMIGARVNQPSRIEPPGTAAPWETGSIGDNTMTYVVGFDSSSLHYFIAKGRWICQRCDATIRQSISLKDLAEQN